VLRTSLQKIWKNAHEEISLISHWIDRVFLSVL
jgi:hypothetical protein